MSDYVCQSCAHLRQPGEPALQPSLSDLYRLGRCANEAGKWVTFKKVEVWDLDAGEQRKREGHRRVLSHADTYAARYRGDIEAMASGTRFTSETVTSHIGMQPPDMHPSVIGALTTACAKLGLIAKTGRRVKARRPNQHAAELTEWVRL